MSHFVVLVVGEDHEYELAPFHEFECTGIDDEFVVDVDETEKVLKHAEKKGKSLQDALAWFGLKDRKIQSESEALRGEGEPHKYGYAVVTPDGRLVKAVDRTNPNHKWDWWVVGGRWSNQILLKDGTTCNRAKKGEIDFEMMRSNAESEAFKDWTDVHAVLDLHSAIIPWNIVREEKFPGEIDKAREFYNAQPGVAAVQAWSKANDYRLGFLCEIEPFLVSRDAYVKSAVENSFVYFAFLKDRKWCERGRMLMFACVSGEKDPETWAATFNNFVASLGDNETLTIVDCHT